MKRKTVWIVLLLLLLQAMIGTVHATNSTFIIEPSTEVTQNVESNLNYQSIAGNVSIIGGTVDFYVTDPSGLTVLQYSNISIKEFSMDITQNGTYIIHLASRMSTVNVTATLYYGSNFAYVASESVRTWHTISTWTMTASSPLSPLSQIISYSQDFALSVLRDTLVAILSTIGAALLIPIIAKKYQKWKDGDPTKTPSTVKR